MRQGQGGPYVVAAGMVLAFGLMVHGCQATHDHLEEQRTPPKAQSTPLGERQTPPEEHRPSRVTTPLEEPHAAAVDAGSYADAWQQCATVGAEDEYGEAWIAQCRVAAYLHFGDRVVDLWHPAREA